MKKNQGSVQIIVTILLVAALVLSVILIGRQTVFKNRADYISGTSPNPFGNALQLVNNGDGVSTTSAVLNGTQAFTVETWVKLAAKPINDYTEDEFILRKMVSKNSDLDYFSLFVSRDRQQVIARFGLSSGYQLITLGNFLADYKWHHVAIVNDPTNTKQTIRLYVDGKSGSSIMHLTPFISDNGGFNIGTYDGEAVHKGSRSFVGYIDEVRYSNNVRYYSDFIPQTVPFIADSATLGLWHLDEFKNSSLNNGQRMTPDASLKRVGGQNDALLRGNPMLVTSTVAVQTPSTSPSITSQPVPTVCSTAVTSFQLYGWCGGANYQGAFYSCLDRTGYGDGKTLSTCKSMTDWYNSAVAYCNTRPMCSPNPTTSPIPTEYPLPSKTPPPPPPKGVMPVSYWMFDEGSWNGTAGEVKDQMGRNNGVSVGVAPSIGRRGNAYSSDGLLDRQVVVKSANGLPSGASPRTMSAWFNMNTNTGNCTRYQTIGGYGWPRANGNFQIEACDMNTKTFWVLGWETYYDWNTGVSSAPYVDGKWHHVTVTFDGQKTTLYLDGAQKATTTQKKWNTPGTTSGSWERSQVVIGNEIDGSGRSFNGKIDDFKIYSTALNNSDVFQLYMGNL